MRLGSIEHAVEGIAVAVTVTVAMESGAFKIERKEAGRQAGRHERKRWSDTQERARGNKIHCSCTFLLHFMLLVCLF